LCHPNIERILSNRPLMLLDYTRFIPFAHKLNKASLLSPTTIMTRTGSIVCGHVCDINFDFVDKYSHIGGQCLEWVVNTALS